MDLLRREIRGNFERFSGKWYDELQDIHERLSDSVDKFSSSYERIVSFNAWREDLLRSEISSESLDFFLEAQNDVLTSHILARLGSWRSSLKALRSCIENTFFCLYYKDHPIELRLWATGEHRLSFPDLTKYFQGHPDICAFRGKQICGIDILKNEYSLLSKAVHGSAKSFRMTGEAGTTLLWSSARDKLGAWATRERLTVCGINMLMATMFRTKLQGTNRPGLRKAISLAIPNGKHVEMRALLGVKLFSI